MEEKPGFRRRALPLLPALAANAAAQSFLLVVLPSLGRDLGFSPLETGLLLGMAALLAILFAPVWGRASERIGRRPVLVAGLAGAAAAPLLMALVIALRLDETMARGTALLLLFAIRAGQSTLSAGLLPAAQAWMADGTGPENRAEGMGLLGAAYGVGGIAGAGAAFAVGGQHPVAALAGLGLCTLLGLGLVWAVIAEGRTAPNATVSGGPGLNRILPCLAITFLGVAVYGVMQHVTALRLEDGFGLSRTGAISRAGAALMAASLVMAIVQTAGLSRLKRPPRTLMAIGSLIGLAAMAGVVLAPTANALTGALVAMGGALGLVLPGNLAFLSLLAGPAAQGRVAGMNALAQGLGMASGPIAGAALHRLSPLAPGLAAALAAALILATCLTLQDGEKT